MLLKDKRKQFTIVNAHTGRFPCFNKGMYQEFDAPRTSATFKTVSFAKDQVKRLERVAKKHGNELLSIAVDYEKDAKKLKALIGSSSITSEEVQHVKRLAANYTKKAIYHAQRKFVIVEIIYRTVR